MEPITDFNFEDDKSLNKFLSDERPKLTLMLQKRYGLSEDDAKDVFQESSYAFLQNAKAGKVDSLTCTLSTYLGSICINKARKLLRDRHVTTSFDDMVENPEWAKYDADQVERILGLSDDVITEKQKLTLRKLVSSLPSPCEEILWGYYDDNLSIDTLATLLNYKNADTVKSRKSQCMSKLRKRFEELKSLFYDK